MLIEYLCKPNTFNAYISPTFSQGKKVFAELTQLLEGTGIVKKSNAADLKIESIYGSTLKFFSMESPTSIRGNTVSGILVMDEAAFFPIQLSDGQDPYYNVIFPIIKARKPKVLVISTPNGRQGMYHDIYLDLITKEEIEELKKGYPPLAFKQEFEVEFLDNALTVFPNFENCFDGRFEKKKCWIGIDPSSVGEDNTIVSIINTDDVVRQYKVEGTLDQKYEKIARIINDYNPVATYIENNIANNAIHFEEDNKLLYSELSTFTFKLTKGGNITYAARDGFHDDTVTSLGVCLQCRDDFKYSGLNNMNFVRTNTKLLY